MIQIVITKENDSPAYPLYKARAMDGTQELSHGTFRICDTRFGQSYVKTLLAGGIGTSVQFRRGGNVKRIMQEMLRRGKEDGAIVSLLHPFSFSYYRMFGFERLSDHLIVRLPLRMLDCVPRHCSLIKLENKAQLKDLIFIYDNFSKGRNLMPARHNGEHFDLNKNTFICYENNVPAGYVTYKTENRFIVNHMGDGLVTVQEIAYTSPYALRELFSFLRMFEGEMDDIEFSNLAMAPEVDLLLRHYTHTSYTTVPDIMGRILDIQAILSAHTYPMENGHFTVTIQDNFKIEEGTFSVEYGNGKSLVQKSNKDADMTLSMQAFTRLIYGYDGISQQAASYMDGVTLHKDCTDFFRAFPKTPCGVFEHF